VVPGTHHMAKLELERAVGLTSEGIQRWKNLVDTSAGFESFGNIAREVLGSRGMPATAGPGGPASSGFASAPAGALLAQPGGTQSMASQPGATQPMTAYPMAAQPAATQPMTSQPSIVRSGPIPLTGQAQWTEPVSPTAARPSSGAAGGPLSPMSGGGTPAFSRGGNRPQGKTLFASPVCPPGHYRCWLYCLRHRWIRSWLPDFDVPSA